MAKLERLSGPYVAQKWDFIYSDGFPFKQGKKFWIIYDKGKNQIFADSKNEIILPKHKNKSLYGKYKKAKKSLSREFYYKPHKLIVLKKHRKKGTINRFFVRRNDDISQRIFEIKEQQFGMNSIFYDTVNLSWKLNGLEDDIKLQNTKALEKADKTFPGIKDLLNPLEFYIKEDLTVKEKVENILYEMLASNDYKYETRAEAKSEALSLGLKRIHLMKNGYWMAGRNHEEYMEAIGYIST